MSRPERAVSISCATTNLRHHRARTRREDKTGQRERRRHVRQTPTLLGSCQAAQVKTNRCVRCPASWRPCHSAARLSYREHGSQTTRQQNQKGANVVCSTRRQTAALWKTMERKRCSCRHQLGHTHLDQPRGHRACVSAFHPDTGAPLHDERVGTVQEERSLHLAFTC